MAIANHLIANGVVISKMETTTFATDNHVGGKLSPTDKDTNVPSKWIPVTERLPDESIPSQHYLCWYKGRVRILKYWRTRKRFESNGRVANVTHWMPLPEPPKEVE